jgi:RHS repeat-associated protein
VFSLNAQERLALAEVRDQSSAMSVICPGISSKARRAACVPFARRRGKPRRRLRVGPDLPRTLIYDAENRPLVVVRNGIASIMAYGPDTERVSKASNFVTTHYLGNDTELRFDTATPSGLITSYLHPDIRREGLATDVLVKDHLASNRVALRVGSSTPTTHNYTAYGRPVTSNGVQLPSSKGYINERFDPETGLSYHHFRYYDAKLGRFLSPDTWEVTQQGVDINRYIQSVLLQPELVTMWSSKASQGRIQIQPFKKKINYFNGRSRTADLLHAMPFFACQSFSPSYLIFNNFNSLTARECTACPIEAQDF